MTGNLAQLRPSCRYAIERENYATVEVTMLNGDVFKVYSMTSPHYDCYYVNGAVNDLLNSGDDITESFILIPIFASHTRQLVFPEFENYPYPASVSYENGNSYENSGYAGTIGTYNGNVVTVYGNKFLLETGSGTCYYPNNSNPKAKGRHVTLEMQVFYSDHSIDGYNHTFYVTTNRSTCFYEQCLGSGTLGGGSFDPSVCCAAGCPANQYGTGCNCTPCPTMVNKAGQTVSGTSTMGDNATVEQCSMGTSHVFSDATGDWSFQPACPAS